MKQLDGIEIEDKAIKEDKKEEIYEYVKTLVRNEELLRAKNKKIFKEGKKKIQNDHANIDVMTAEENVIHTSLGKDTEDFIKANSFNQRKEVTDFCCVVMGKIPPEAVLKTNKVTDKEIHSINALDLMVRCTIFKCMHEDHNICDIDAKIMVLDENGQENEVIVSAGYCAQCNIYFIMDSVYQNLKKQGIILCRITDEKTYLKGGFMNGAKLAQESILMQYGYNVSQIDGLSATRRQKILAVIIDNKVLSKNEIISYLDFFIWQHGRRSNMEFAVAKWENDRDFVEHYRIGEYTQYGVNAIHRR